jgi:two-component system, LytTR family, sensor kinase
MKLPAFKQIAKAYLWSIGIWSALSSLTGWQYFIFDKSMNIHSTPGQMLILAEARGLTFALLAPPVFYLAGRYNFAVRHRLKYLLCWSLGAVPYMFSYACIRWLIFPLWDGAKQGFLPRADTSPWLLVHEGYADIITIYVATVLAAHGYGYFQRVRFQALERAEYQQALAASELHALKMQLHPHFLFNTLHGISTLIDSDGVTAKAMILKLSHLLRTALECSGSDLIPLREELEFIGEYLDLETMRFGPRLRVDWSIDPSTGAMLVPQLILQPLVENAIRHGIGSSRDNGWVEVTSRRRKNAVELQIRNSVGPGKPKGMGLGLHNTAARLKHLYSGEGTFSFAVSEAGTATVTIVVPRFVRSDTENELAASETLESEVKTSIAY